MPRSSPPSLLWKTWQQALSGIKPHAPSFTQAETGRAVSFRTLNERAENLAQQFVKASGSWVAFSMRNDADWLAVFLACQATGAAAMPLDAHLPTETLAGTARTLGAHYLWQNGTLIRLSAHDGAKSKIACIKTTSGTTGQMQTVPCLPGHLIADGENIIATMKIRRGDKNLGLIPLGHSYGLGNLVMPLLLQGTPLFCAGEFVPSQILPWISKYIITVFPSVPGLLRILAQLPGRKSAGTLRTVISAGAPLSADIASAFYHRFGLKIHNFYGSSETGGICYDRSGTASLTGRSVGKPLQGVKVELDFSNHIRVRSGAVAMPGKKHLLPDLGQWNRQGELTLLARAQSVANIGGKKVAPAEIEETLRRIQGVDDAWVGVIHLKNRDYLAAAVESSKTRHELQEKLHEQLPAWKVPRFLKVEKSLPRTPRGKLHRVAVRALFPA